MQSGGSFAGGKAAGGRASRPGGGIGGTPAARRTPYGRPQSGIESGASRASGLATPGLPPAARRDPDGEYNGGQPTPGNFAAPEPAGTPSTISRFLTPIKAAGGYFFGSVSACSHPNIYELFHSMFITVSLIHTCFACAAPIQVGTLLGAGNSPGVRSNSPGESPFPPVHIRSLRGLLPASFDLDRKQDGLFANPSACLAQGRETLPGSQMAIRK